MDTSVTPLMTWSEPAHTGGQRGIYIFRSAPFEPYYPSQEDVTSFGTGPIIEVPVSICLTRPLPPRIANWLMRLPRDNNFLRALRWTRVVRHGWLSPGREPDGRRLIGIARALIALGVPMLNVMFHSSEMAPRTSPRTRIHADVENSYQQLKILFDYLIHEVRARSLTLSEFAASWQKTFPAPPPTPLSDEGEAVQQFQAR